MVNLAYDPLGRLWQVWSTAATTQFLYDGDHEALEYSGNGAILWRYYFGPGADEPILADSTGSLSCGGTRFLHVDHEGSMIATDDCSGNRATVATYDEYGIPGANNWGRFQYTGQAWIPEIGMYYYKARIYSPTLGRFMQTDPVGYDGGINIYEYADDDPIDDDDPNGECDAVCAGAIIGAVVNVGFEAAEEYGNGHFSTSGLASAAVGGAVTGALLARSSAMPELAGAAGGAVQYGLKAIMDGESYRTVMRAAAWGAGKGAIVGGLGRGVMWAARSPIGRAAARTTVGRLVRNNQRFANMAMGRFRAHQMPASSLMGRTGARLAGAAAATAAAPEALVHKGEDTARDLNLCGQSPCK